MPAFSPLSRERLATCDQQLQDLFSRVVEHWDCTVIEGHRGKEAQEKAFRDGTSTKHWPDGRHNSTPSEAVDVAPYPVDWEDTKRFLAFGGFVLGVAAAMGIPIRWGGDWDMKRDLNRRGELQDLVHHELVRLAPVPDAGATV